MASAVRCLVAVVVEEVEETLGLALAEYEWKIMKLTTTTKINLWVRTSIGNPLCFDRHAMHILPSG